MSLYGENKTAVIASGGTVSGEVDLGMPYEFIQIVLPTLTSCKINLQVSLSSGGTFQALGNGVTNRTSTGGYTTTFRLGGFQYIKVVSSAAQGAERTFTLRGLRG